MKTAPERPQEERRQHPRHEVAVRVHIAQLGDVDGALTSDISRGGLFVRTQQPYAVGSCLPVRIIDPSTAEQIPTICEVVRQVTEDGKVVGLGLRFVHLDDYLRDRLSSFIGGVTGEEPEPEPKPIEVDPSEIEPAPAEPSAGLPPLAVAPDVLAMVPLDAVPVLRGGDLPISLDPMLVHILTLTDGARTAEDIIRASGLSMGETLTGIHDLSQRGIIDITVDLAPAIVEVESVPLAEEHHEAREVFVADKARDCVAEAMRAEHAGRVAEAVHLLEQALALKPPNAADIHVHLARMAITKLKNVGLARLHADKLKQLSPERDTVTRLVAEIDSKESAIAAERARRASGHDHGRPVDKRGATKARARVTPAQVSPRRKALAAIAVLALLGSAGYLAAYFWLPRGPQPKQLDQAALAGILPAKSGQVLKERLFVRVTNRWEELSDEQKRARLVQLAEWARSEHGVTEVVVSDGVPVLVGRVSGDDVTVY